jgi:hypothetical protein
MPAKLRDWLVFYVAFYPWVKAEFLQSPTNNSTTVSVSGFEIVFWIVKLTSQVIFYIGKHIFGLIFD